MSVHYLAPIVEGFGEGAALEILLQRLHQAWKASQSEPARLAINQPIRVKSCSFLNDDQYFYKYVTLAAGKAKAQANGSVLILLDCEDECPAELGPRLLQRAQSVRNDTPFLVVLAHREFETWFLTAAESLRLIGGLPGDLCAPQDPTQIRGAKEWLGKYLPHGYRATEHQPQFTRHFSLVQAAASPSFARFQRKLREAWTAPS